MNNHRRIVCLAVLCMAVAGCRSSPTAPADTGSRAAVQTYFDALVRRDWPAAYGALHADSRKRWTQDQFARAAEGHRRALGFEPEEMHLNSCEEHGPEATAHVLLTGHAGGKSMTYKDAVVVKHGDATWGIILPRHFGNSRGH